MKNIRTFILCSSAVLCSWLVASYTYEPKLASTEQPTTKEELTTTKELITTMATIKEQ